MLSSDIETDCLMFIFERYSSIDSLFQHVTDSIALPSVLNQKISLHNENNDLIQLKIHEIDQHNDFRSDKIFRSVS